MVATEPISNVMFSTTRVFRRLCQQLSVGAFILGLGLAALPQLRATPIPPETENLFTLIEATHTDTAFLGLSYGDSVDRALSGTGTYAGTGWTWTMSDTYLSLPLRLTYIGTRDAATNTVNWTGSGAYGLNSWHSFGAAQFPTDDSAIFTANGSVGDPNEWSVSLSGTFHFGGTNPPGWAVSGTGSFTEDEHGTSVTVSDGFDFTQIGGIDWNKTGEVKRQFDDVSVSGIVKGTGTATGSTVKATVTVSKTPEPSTALLLGGSLLLLVFWRITAKG